MSAGGGGELIFAQHAFPGLRMADEIAVPVGVSGDDEIVRRVGSVVCGGADTVEFGQVGGIELQHWYGLHRKVRRPEGGREVKRHELNPFTLETRVPFRWQLRFCHVFLGFDLRLFKGTAEEQGLDETRRIDSKGEVAGSGADRRARNQKRFRCQDYR